MNSDKPLNTLSTQSVKRLPLYLRILSEMRDAGDEYASSAVVAEQLNFDPIMVRKDLAGCGVTGVPRKGFLIADLCREVERILGCNVTCEAIMVGVGKLGAALLGHSGFEQYGIQIVVAFDLKPLEVNRVGIPVYSMQKLEEVVAKTKAKIGILTVPADVAQSVADRMIAAGIKGIWNFTPVHLKIPEGVIVKRENLATSLIVLSHRMRSAKLI
ncbi:MAG: redox-sensing transcriptional repressor Rex [bacterium]